MRSLLRNPQLPWKHLTIHTPRFSFASPVRHRGFSAAASNVHSARRLRLWEEEKDRQRTLLESTRATDAASLSVVLPDGKGTFTATPGAPTPWNIATKALPEKVTGNPLVALLNGEHLWDLGRPLPPFPSNVVHLELLSYATGSADDEAANALRRSLIHLLGLALEETYGDAALLVPALASEQGRVLCDVLLLDDFPTTGSVPERISKLLRASVGSDKRILDKDLEILWRLAFKRAKSNLIFERLDVPFPLAREMFRENPFKLYAIDQMQPSNTPKSPSANLDASPEPTVPIYRTGPFVDISTGPHVRSTKQLVHGHVSQVSRVHWTPVLQSDPKAHPALHRIYGNVFPTSDSLKKWLAMKEEAARRDHRVIGKKQRLFTFHPSSPGSAFLLPHGTRIVAKLLDMIRTEYRLRGFEEVMTPQIYKKELWMRSGHWENYKDDMFTVVGGDGAATGGCCGSDRDAEDVPNEANTYGLKPMNCPGHCLLFAGSLHSYRDLPVRYADFSPLHRNESLSTLSGLTRVRRFHQDDAHIFCTESQIFSEIESTLAFVHNVYTRFGFPSYDLYLSTRPSTFIGTESEWDQAEEALRTALDATGKKWTLRPGDGAFYGPKIDIVVRDALERPHQTATIQLDFQLGRRFELRYLDPSGQPKTPVIIHRAVLGSLERMLAVLVEHHAGKWPFWISPRQALVVPVSPAFAEYATQIYDSIHSKSHRAHHVDLSDSERGASLAKSIREAQQIGYNYVLVVGQREMENGTVTVRKRGDGSKGQVDESERGNDTSVSLGEMTVDQVLEMFSELNMSYR